MVTNNGREITDDTIGAALVCNLKKGPELLRVIFRGLAKQMVTNMKEKSQMTLLEQLWSVILKKDQSCFVIFGVRQS